MTFYVIICWYLIFISLTELVYLQSIMIWLSDVTGKFMTTCSKWNYFLTGTTFLFLPFIRKRYPALVDVSNLPNCSGCAWETSWYAFMLVHSTFHRFLCFGVGFLACWDYFLGVLSLVQLVFKSSEDWGLVDKIYRCLILRYVAETSPHDMVPKL